MNKRAEVAGRIAADLQALRLYELQKGRAAAAPRYQELIAAIPSDPELLMTAAQRLAFFHRFDEAIALAEKAAKLAAPAPAAKFFLGQIYYLARRIEEAIATYQELLAKTPAAPAMLTELGIALESVARRDEAREAFERAIAASPRFAPALHERVLLDRVRAGAPIIAALERASDRIEGYPVGHRVRLLYARAKAFDDLGETDRAFPYFAEAAALYAKLAPFKDDEEIRAHEAARRIFTPERLLRRLSAAPAEPHFIFLLGMPRSGTTLTEQILLGAPETAAIGESPALVEAFSPWLDGRDVLNTASESLDGLFTHEKLEAAHGHYLERSADYLPAAARTKFIIDKTPTNYVGAGFISVAFPTARLVHCRRDPLDTCWSLFSTWFRQGTYWSYDQAAIGRFFGRYHAAMAMWRERLPKAVFDLDYEDLVAEPEQATKRLFDHCGLNWSHEAGRYSGSDRKVVTPSMSQVRQPIYRSSVRRVEPYLPHLGPLRRALAEAGIET